MASTTAAKAAQAVSHVIPVHKKYTLQSTGIWERVRRLLAVDATRSNGVPLNPQFRNPPPGANAPFSFTDPVTLPAADIAENAYFRRDARRAYPQLAVVRQRELGALLTLGSAAHPRRELVGEEGRKEIVRVVQGGEGEGDGAGAQQETGLARVLGEQTDVASLMDSDGLPPKPVPLGHFGDRKVGAYDLTEEQAYPGRTFQ